MAQVGPVKLYVAAVKELREKERGDETQFTTKIGKKNSFGPVIIPFVKFGSQLSIWCPMMPKLDVLAPWLSG